MPTFYRGLFSELWVTLQSDEVLGLLDSDYLEDYFGVDGQVTLRYENGNPYTVLMNEVPETTPSIPHDVFTGPLTLSTVPDGLYTVQGRVRDLMGNYTILSGVETPLGNERIINLTFTISSAAPPTSLIVLVGPVKLMGGITLTTNFLTPPEFVVSWQDVLLETEFMQPLTLESRLLGE